MRSVAAGIVGLMVLQVVYLGVASAPRAAAEDATDAIAATSDDTGSGSGIAGEVIIRPVRPHATIGEQNLKPYQATIEVIDSDGRVVRSIQSDPAGTFRIEVPPGTYTLQPQSPGLYPRASAQTVVVEPKAFTQVRITYDTGIR
jgi:hypothetical protein